MRSKSIIAVLVIAAFLAVMIVCPISNAEATDSSDVSLKTNSDTVEIESSGNANIPITITNNLEYSENPDLANQRLIYISLTSEDNVTATISENFIILAGQEHKNLEISLVADRYSSTGTYKLTIDLEIQSLDSNDTTKTTITYTISMVVSSSLDDGAGYNKILGIFTNPLPSPFNEPLATAIISFFIAIMIGLAIILIATPILMNVILHDYDKQERKKYRRTVEKFLFLIVILYSIDISLSVYGAPLDIISTFKTWSDVLYIMLGAIIAWNVYEAFISYTLTRIHNEIVLGDVDDLYPDEASDLEPLFRLIGKIVISAIAVGAALASFGFDLAAVITSAGLVTLGITWGAQSVLNQFFSGIVLLVTRPFKTGDLVQIGTTGNTFKVNKVSVMYTTFENWSNEEIITMPNNSVASSAITNITGKGLIYKIQVFMTIAYGEDIDKAKKIMLDIGSKHPEAVLDGTVDLPYVRVTAFQDSAIQLRLTVFVRDYNNYSKVQSELGEAIYKKFMEENINIPFPQMDVHVDYPKKGE